MSETYSQCPRCNYTPAAPLPMNEACPACGIYPFKWEHHLSSGQFVPTHQPTASSVSVTTSSLRTRWAAVEPIIRIKIGLMLAFLGGFMAAESLASGMVFKEWKGYVFSRARAPLVFWFLVLSASASAIFGAYLAFVDLMQDPPDSEVAALGINRTKTFQYLGLFCILAVIYSIYFMWVIERREIEIDPMWPLAKVCLISALPFGVMAWAERPWRSSDAAPVSVAAWIAVFYVFLIKYPGQCPFSAFLLFVPLVLSALVGHTVGAIRHQQAPA